MGQSKGRPPKYKTPGELQVEIDKYVTDCTDSGIPLTITGLCYRCGFESRQSFYAYEQKEEFSYTIKRARLLIERSYELKLQDKSYSGAIFALKNMGWTDRQEIDHTSGGEAIGFSIDIVDADTDKAR